MLKRLTLMVIVVIATNLRSQAVPTTAPANDAIITRVYDISDLLWQKTDYYAPAQTMELTESGRGGGGGGGGQNLFGGGQPTETPAPSRQDLVDNIVKLMQDTIAAETWKANGGNIGSMRELSGQLVVTQLPENHQKIQEVLT